MAYIGKSPGTGVRNRFIYTATAAQTTFSGSDDHSRTLSYTDAEFMDVFLNGVKLDKSDYTATSGTSIVLGSGATAGDNLEVLAFDTFSVFSGEFSQDVTIGGTLDMQGGEVILDADGDTSITADTDDRIDFRAGGSDTAHVTSTDLLVGKTTTAIGTAGSRLINNGQIQATASGQEPYFANRLSDDGTLFDFRQDGTTVGTIGVESGDNFYLATGSTPNTGINFKTNFIAPCDSTGSQRDNAIDLGDSAARFNDLYLGGGVYLGGTGSANKLDDYEVGTWSPHIKDSSDNTVKVTATDQGKYVKIGEIVHVHFRIYANSVSASFTGFPFVQLPFATIDGSELNGVQVAYRLAMNTIKGASTQGSTSTMKFSTVNENPYGSMINVGPYTLSGNVRFYGMLTYRVS